MEAEPPKADPPKRKRRWFQFSLRTLMIGVTLLAVVCGYVGWQAKIVRQRRAMGVEINNMQGPGALMAADKTFYPDCTVPWVRSLLGDEPVSTIELPSTVSTEYRDHIRALFPEARLWCLDRRDGTRFYMIGRPWPEDVPSR
jgi:hypothetical protein